jgi:general secretion pathway protein A
LQAKGRGLVFRCHLAPLQDDEVGSFIHHRLAVAGRDGDVAFSPAAVERIAELARGNPQAIVTACRQACAVARRRRIADVSREIVEEAMAAHAAAPVVLDKLAGASRHVRRRLVGGARLWLALSLALAAGGGIVAVELAKEAGPSAAAPGSVVSRPLPPR